MKKVLEKDIQLRINRKLRDKKFFVHKISDMASGSKPFDFFGITDSKIFYLELKKVKKANSFRFSQIQESQMASLTKIERNLSQELSKFVLRGFVVSMINDKGHVIKNAYIPIMDIVFFMKQKKNKISWKNLFKYEDIENILEIEYVRG